MTEQCPHRNASLYFGFIEPDGIRCCYHGWKFDCATGACIERPFETAAPHGEDAPEGLSGAATRRSALRLYGSRSGAGAAAAALGRNRAHRPSADDRGAARSQVQLAADSGKYRRQRAHVLPARRVLGGQRTRHEGRCRILPSADRTVRLGRLALGHREVDRVRRRAARDRNPPAVDLSEHPADPGRTGRVDALPRSDRRHVDAHHLGRPDARGFGTRWCPMPRCPTRCGSIRRTSRSKTTTSRPCGSKIASCGKRRARSPTARARTLPPPTAAS